MLSSIRKSVVAMGAAALLSSQTVYAVPVRTVATVDPLVAVSILGTPQSRAAVCTGEPGCGLPMAASTATAAAASAAASATAIQDDPRRRDTRGVFWILLLGGGMVLIAVLVAALAGNEDAPVSPA